MNDGGRVAMSILVGAVAGGMLGFLYLTDQGGVFRAQAETRLDDFIAEMRRLRRTIEKSREAAQEAWRSVSEVVGEAPPPRNPWETPRPARR